LSYSVWILRRAQKELTHLQKASYYPVRDRILALADDPRPAASQKLTGRDGWRLRVGAFRVLYEIDDASNTVTILHVGHRRDIYRR